MRKGWRPRRVLPKPSPCSISQCEAGAGAASTGSGRTISQTSPQCGTEWRGPSPQGVPLPGAFVHVVTQQLHGLIMGAACGAASFPRRILSSGQGSPFHCWHRGRGAWGVCANTLALPGGMRQCGSGREEGRQHQTVGRARTKGSLKGESGVNSASKGKFCES